MDVAIAAGKVLPAGREAALAPLVNAATPEAFTAAAVALANAKQVMKISARASGGPRREQKVADRQEQFLALVNSYQKDHQCDYDTAFAAVRKANPAIFGEPTEAEK